MKIEAIFPSPITVLDFDSEALNQQLKRLFLDMEQDNRFIVANETKTLQKNIFESTFDLFDLEYAEIQQLKQNVLNALSHFINELEGRKYGKIPVSNMKVDAWFHITRNGGYISTHTHPMASWSGVYYVDSGYLDAPDPQDDNGVLRFIDTRSFNMYQDRGNIALQRPFNFGSINIPPANGRLVLFPSYLQHEASPFIGDGERICVAFNVSIPMPEDKS